MPIVKRWSRFTNNNVNGVRNVYEVYELGDSNGVVIYIGSGKLHDRLNHWKSSSESCKRNARNFRHEELGSADRCSQKERALLANFMRKHGKLPRCNERLG